MKLEHCWHMTPVAGGFIKAQDMCCYCGVAMDAQIQDAGHGEFAPYHWVNRRGEECSVRTALQLNANWATHSKPAAEQEGSKPAQKP